MLAANLQDYLLIHGAICVPDFGKFSWINSAPKMISSRGKLALEKSKALFEHGVENIDSWNQFIEFSAWKWNLPVQNITAQYELELDTWKNQFAENSKLEIEGIGLLQKNNLKSIVLFPIANSIHLGSDALPMIDLTPIHRNTINPVESALSTNIEETIVKQRKTHYGKELLFGFLLFLLLCIIYFWIFNPDWLKKETPKNLAEFAHIDERRLNQDPVEFSNGTAFDSSEEVITEQKKADTASTNSDNELLKDESLQEDHKEDSCVIIVGSFLNLSRANRMEDKLQLENKNVHTEYFGDYKRIGYTVTCDSLMPELNKARNQIDPKSWILQ